MTSTELLIAQFWSKTNKIGHNMTGVNNFNILRRLPFYSAYLFSHFVNFHKF